MKAARRKGPSPAAPGRDLTELRQRLANTEEALRAIRGGEVDTVVVTGKQGPQVFTLEGAEQAYRMLIESMNEGALTLTIDKTVLYANRCFARMVKCPLEQVIGGTFRRFLSDQDQLALRSHLKQPGESGSKIQATLHASDGSKFPVQISVRSMEKRGAGRATFGMVVTDISEARHNEEALRALAHRVVQVQEEERGRVSRELHDGITQLLCGILFHSQALVTRLSDREGPAKSEAVKLRDIAGKTAGEVERISRNLRPGLLDQLGLISALRDAGKEFASRTGIPVKMECAPLAERLPGGTELALYRILQEALRNVEKYARARQVTVCLTQSDSHVQMAIQDDGIGFDPDRKPSKREGKGGLGLLGMRERAGFVGGTLQVHSSPRAGTKIKVRVPQGDGPSRRLPPR